MTTDAGLEHAWFATGDAMLAATAQAVAAATRSVWLETYICTDSPAGRGTREQLVAAARRGVQVRVLVDSIGSLTLPGSFWRPLTAAGGEVKWFNPLRLDRFAIRDHRKLLVCDDTVAFIGGFNLSAETSGDGVRCGWCDLGLRVTGPLAAKLGETFTDMFARSELLHARLYRLRRSHAKRALGGPGWQLLLSGPGWGLNPFVRALSRDLAHAREVRIITPYFLPSLRLRRRLTAVARSGGQVQLLLPAKSDVPMTRFAAQSLYRRLLRSGVAIHEYLPQILHAKLYLVDDIVYVGSSNFDPRSLRINYELMVRFTDPALAVEARAIFAANLEHSRRVRPERWQRARPCAQRLRQRWAYFLLATLDPLVASWQYRRLRAATPPPVKRGQPTPSRK
jgi:cardiolipin synthase